jgi:hypothetical protein
MTPTTLKAKLIEFRKLDKLREEKEQRDELRRLAAGSSWENMGSVGKSNTRRMVVQRV